MERLIFRAQKKIHRRDAGHAEEDVYQEKLRTLRTPRLGGEVALSGLPRCINHLVEFSCLPQDASFPHSLSGLQAKVRRRS